MAAAPKPKSKVDPAVFEAKGTPTFYALSDGSLSNVRIERYALFIADDVPDTTAWAHTGGRGSGGSYQYRRRVDAFPVFIERVAALRAEKELFMADPVLGEIKWMASQMWREARAKGDSTMMQKAADLRWKIAEKESAMRPAESQDAPSAPGRVGKPSVENPQTSSSMDEIRQRLANKGVPAPGSAPAAAAPRVPPPAAPVQDDSTYGDDDFEARLARAVPA